MIKAACEWMDESWQWLRVALENNSTHVTLQGASTGQPTSAMGAHEAGKKKLHSVCNVTKPVSNALKGTADSNY